MRCFLCFSLALALALSLTPSTTLAQAPPIILINDTSSLDQAYIQSGALVTNYTAPNANGVIARYTGVDLGETVASAECTATFENGGAIAIIAGPISDWSIDAITRCSLHAVFTATGYHFGFFENGTLTDVLAGEYTLDTSGETAYTFGFTVRDKTITLRLPNGKKDVKYDQRAIVCNGSRIIFEHYLTPGDIAAGARPAITSVAASGKRAQPLSDDFARADGLPGTAPSGHIYTQFHNDIPAS